MDSIPGVAGVAGVAAAAWPLPPPPLLLRTYCFRRSRKSGHLCQLLCCDGFGFDDVFGGAAVSESVLVAASCQP